MRIKPSGKIWACVKLSLFSLTLFSGRSTLKVSRSHEDKSIPGPWWPRTTSCEYKRSDVEQYYPQSRALSTASPDMCPCLWHGNARSWNQQPYHTRIVKLIQSAKQKIGLSLTSQLQRMTQQQEFGWGVSWISLLLNYILKPSYLTLMHRTMLQKPDSGLAHVRWFLFWFIVLLV